MQASKTLAISVGDLNGIGFEIILKSHHIIKQWCTPLYCINESMAQQAAKLLGVKLPEDFFCLPIKANDFTITPGEISQSSGLYSYVSFIEAVKCVTSHQAKGVVTLPIHKKAWELAGLKFKGHTDVLRHLFGDEGIMMLGCEEMFVALFTDHIPLKNVPKTIKTKKITRFLLTLASSLDVSKIAVLGLNPHAGDFGVLGKEEFKISKAIKMANETLGRDLFIGPLVPDTAFTPQNIKNYTHFVAMYHDQGLIPLKTLYFDQSINVTLGLPIIRTSVDHGTAFDKAYNNDIISSISYINAITYALFKKNNDQ